MADKKTHKHSRATAIKAKKEHTCAVEGCKNTYRAKGYCKAHYVAWREGQFGKARYKLCSKAECKKPVNKHGLCETHYKEWWGARHPDAAPAAAPAAPAAAPAAG